MRTFTLINEYAQSYDLNTPSTGFLQDPEGLGYEADASYMRIGTSWVRDSYHNAQAMPKGVLAFMPPRPYDGFAEFLSFVRASKKLTLVYTTTAGTYKKDVDIISIEKTEISEENGVLLCNIQFAARSLWYSSNASTIVIDSAEGLQLPFDLPVAMNDQTSGQIAVTNAGSDAAAFTVILYGAISNPVIALYQDGVELYRAAINASADLGQSIEWSSLDDDLYCVLNDNGTYTNLINTMSLTNANFFKIPSGNSTIKITANSSITGSIVITPRIVYKAV